MYIAKKRRILCLQTISQVSWFSCKIRYNEVVVPPSVIIRPSVIMKSRRISSYYISVISPWYLLKQHRTLLWKTEVSATPIKSDDVCKRLRRMAGEISKDNRFLVPHNFTNWLNSFSVCYKALLSIFDGSCYRLESFGAR